MFLQNISLAVTIKEESASGFDLIDEVTVSIGMCDLSSPPTKHVGANGIASVTLAYTITTTREDYKPCVNPSERCSKTLCYIFDSDLIKRTVL